MKAPVYLDNAATTFPKPESVYQAVMQAMREVGASPGRGGYRRSLEASRILFRVREAAAALFSVTDSSRIIFTHSATESLNMALRGVLMPGDRVVTTSMEHNSLLRPLFQLAESIGVEVVVVEAARDGLVDPADMRRALAESQRTRMVAVSHISNVCGAIQPIDDLAAIAREHGALFLLDGAQSAGCEQIDVTRTGIDLLAVPGHKGLLGPQGTGLLYAAPGVRLSPLLAGGTGTESSSEEQPETFPEGYESGTHNLPGIAGLGAGIEFVSAMGGEEIGRRERCRVNEAVERLSGDGRVRLHGPADPARRGAVLSMTFDDADPAFVASFLDHERDISVRTGLHCAPRAHRTIGTFPGGTLRISPGVFTTSEDIAIFCDAIVECLDG